MIFDYITIIIKSENDSLNTNCIEFFTDPLLGSYITHLYTLVCYSLDVTFGIKATCVMWNENLMTS